MSGNSFLHRQAKNIKEDEFNAIGAMLASIEFDLSIEEYKNDVPLPAFVPRPSFGNLPAVEATGAPKPLEDGPAPILQQPRGRQDESDVLKTDWAKLDALVALHVFKSLLICVSACMIASMHVFLFVFSMSFHFICMLPTILCL